jgi:cysteine desulfurase
VIYLDHHSTTPVDARVLAVMLPYFSEKFGNAASRQHAYGWAAERAVTKARAQVAALCGATPDEIVFTSGATESCNLALKGLWREGAHYVSVVTEHAAVLDTLRALAAEVTLLPVDANGLITAQQVADALRPNTVCVAVMAANNEIGVLQPVAEIAALCRARDVPFFCDAAQAAGLAPIAGDLLALSAHKIYGPKGVGALRVRRGVSLRPQMHGGGHENGLRSGSLDVPGIVGFGAAAALATDVTAADVTAAARMRELRDRLRAALQMPGVVVNGEHAPRLPNNLNLSISGVDSATLLLALPELAVSSGAACASATPGPSHVLRALGRRETEASLRFGIGRSTTAEEIDQAAAMVRAAIDRLRLDNPLAEL